MKLTGFAVGRPVFTTMAALVIALLGAIAFRQLPIDLMPDITYPTLTIRTQYENASPQEIEELITRPIEEATSAVPGVEEVSSASSEGISIVRVSFGWGTDLEAVANDLRDRLDRTESALPEEAGRPMLFKFDLASFPILILGAYGDLDPVQMRRIIDDQVKYRIERVPGVASLDVWGGYEREIRVSVHAEKIKALGLPLDRILTRIRAGNINLPAGTIERGNMEVLVRTPGEYDDLDELRNMVVAQRDGAPIRLGDIADVEDTWQKITRIVRVDGKPGVRLAVRKQAGTNTVTVADAALKEIEKINRDLPQIHLTPIIDTSDYIRRSITNVGTAALFGGLLAILVLLVFLRSLRSTVVVAVSIPLSIIATFALIYFSGFTLNLMTIGGLALGVGMLVDNAIVVLENIFRQKESGVEGNRAAVEGTEEVSGAIVASTLTTLAVFVPLVFVQGMAGVMFKQLAIVVGFALLASLAVALTLVPMMSARILRGTGGSGGESGLAGWVGRMFESLERTYMGLLRFSLDHRFISSGACLLLLGGSLALIPLVGSEFMPQTDEGEVRVNVELEVGTKLEVVDRTMSKVEEIVRESVPEARNIVVSAGGSNWRGSGGHTGRVRLALVPIDERERSSEEIAADLRRKLADIPGAEIRTRAGGGLFILRLGGRGDGERVQIDVRGYDLETAEALAEQVKESLARVDGITDVRLSRETGTPEEQIRIDRLRAADMKLTVSRIAEMLQTVVAGTRAGNFREGGDEYRILVKIKDSERMDLRDILDLTITNEAGEAIVLRNVCDVTTGRGPVQIERKDQERTITVNANTSGRDLGSILSDVREELAGIPVPRDFSLVPAGDFEEQQKAFRELLISLILALVLVYMVMACQFESIRDPFIVMFSVPMAVIGVVLLLFFTRTTLNVQSFIGCIMLGGIVINNAILLVDHTNLLRRRDRMPLRQAVEEAGRRRLRPILMTALTTMLGLLPLGLALGEGGEVQAPMARAVIGGLLSSTLITLVFIPVVYTFVARRRA